jgi:monofunctional biosynthetic peptidoglycan transglycosylase
VEESVSPPAVGGVVVRLGRWLRTHKLRTVLIVVGGFILYEVSTIPFYSIARLKWENTTETALMRQRMSEARREGKKLTITQRWIPLSRVPKHAVDAVIVAEDGLFFSHGGVDWFEVKESIEKNIDRRRAVRGASTITQQLAKNLYLSTSKDPVRKLKELAITLVLENQLEKHRILEIYLNVIEWGRGVFGIEAAARTYFDKSASDLTYDEALRLAAVIPNPLRHRPNEDSRYVLRRAEIVNRRLQARTRPGQQYTQPGVRTPDTIPIDTISPPMPVPEEELLDSIESEEEEPYGP